ncbi:response regulator [Polaribacter ponticola]|uniref:Response regulator n=1 Tax=Polaribacter ponticola TaxID=2978475 RepID=A0ABT5SBC0_9FLAO|nr:response regulator [Polaribacter sp. MSW5]MDD7915383.1 response regulator [Polaribacter sp. MSW5]
MKPLKILLVDDDKIQRIKFIKVCKENKSTNTIVEAENGEKALLLLDDNTKPYDLIISDLNMPRMNGFEFLLKLKKSNKFKNIPVVIMSTSNNKLDLKKCFDIGISGYFTKPLKYSEYSKKVTSLLEYWAKSEVVC